VTGDAKSPVVAQTRIPSRSEDVRNAHDAIRIPLTKTIAVSFTDADLSDVGHTAAITGVARSGETAGLAALTDAQLMALVTPETVIKAAGSSSGSVNLDFSAASTVFDYLATGQIVTLMVDHAWSAEDSLGARRLHTGGDGRLEFEDRLEAATLQGLVARGFDLVARPWGGLALGGQSPAVWFDDQARLFGAPDPRRNGGAAAL